MVEQAVINNKVQHMLLEGFFPYQHFLKLKDSSRPPPFSMHRNYENCMVKRNVIALPQVVLLDVCLIAISSFTVISFL